VSKRVEDGRRPATLWAGHPRNGRKAVLGVPRPQVVEESGPPCPGETFTESTATPCHTPMSLCHVYCKNAKNCPSFSNWNPMPTADDGVAASRGRLGVWQGVAIESLRYHQGPSCLTLLRPVGGHPGNGLSSVSGVAARRAEDLLLNSTLLDAPHRTSLLLGEAGRGTVGRNLLLIWSKYCHPVSGHPTTGKQAGRGMADLGMAALQGVEYGVFGMTLEQQPSFFPFLTDFVPLCGS